MPHLQTPRTHGRPRRVLRRSLIGLAAGVLALVALGFVFEIVAAAASARRHPPAGERYEVDGVALHLHCVGAGSPTVVLESGAGAGMLAWAWVQPEVARETRVCAYDRAGYGWSDGGSDDVDAERVVEQLRTLLRAAGEAGPFVAVGHSLGGHYVRVFADSHPDEVSGVVLVDARHPALPERMDGYDAWLAEGEQTVQVGLALSYVGVLRLLGDVFGAMETLPEDVAAAMVATTMRPRHMRAHLAEVRSLPALDARAAAVGDLGERPVAVLAAGTVADEQLDPDVWIALQEDLAGLSPGARYHLVPEADHLSILTDEGHAAVVSEAIVDVVRRVREGP